MEHQDDNLLQQHESALCEMDQLLTDLFNMLQNPTTEAETVVPPNSITNSNRWRRHSSFSSNSDGEHHYTKRIGACGIQGQFYEIKMSFLVFLRCVNSGFFYLASNLKDTGAFDDIVLKYRDELTGETRTYFIQLKHKTGNKKSISRNEFLCLTGDFSLIKYFLSYRDEICVQYSIKENPTIFSGNLQESEFILYTNAIIVQHKQSRGQLSENVIDGKQTEGFLSTSTDGISHIFTEEKDPDVFQLPQTVKICTSLLQELDTLLEQVPDRDAPDIIKDKLDSFEMHPKLLSKLRQNPTRNEVKKLLKDISEIGDMSTFPDFLKKLKLYHHQSSQSGLDSIIKAEIEKYFQTSVEGTHMIYEKLLRDFEEWWNNGNFYLTEKTKFWTDVIISHKEEPYNLSKAKIIAIKQLKIKFRDDIIVDMKSFITNTPVVHIVTKGESTILTCCKVYHSLCSEPRDSFIFMNWGSALAQRDVVLCTWHTRWANVLILEDVCDNEDAESFFQEIAKILVDHPHKKLIVITREDLLQTNAFQHIHIDIFNDKINLLDLNVKSQEQILKKSIRFQGYNVPLGELVGSYQELKEMVTEDILIKLAQGERIIIGEDLPMPIINYIPRMLERKDHISSDIQTVKELSARFAVSGVTVEELQQAISPKQRVCTYNSISDECRFVVLDKNGGDKDFHELSKESSTCHWLHKEGNIFKVKQVNGNTEILHQYIDDTKTSLFKPKTVWDLPGRTAVVTAEPGMGKSTLVKYIAKQTKMASPSTWVIHINFNSYTELMENLDSSTLSQDEVVQFLLTSARIHRGVLEEKLFQLSIFTTGKMVVFFDGFDEICPYYENVCLKIIELLLLTKIDKIWITSRTTCINKLEMITSSLAFGLTPFSEEEQKQFLRKVWMKRGCDSDLMSDVISELLERIAITLNDSEKRFSAIPLQTMIISEVYEQHLKESLMAGCVKLPEQLDILQLYDGFFRKKFEIYFREKKGDDLTKPAVRRDNELCWLKTDENHKAVALVELLSQQDLGALHDKDILLRAKTCLEGFQSGTEMTGIIDSVTNGKPHFIHRTFLEYFSAKWFAENYSQNQDLIRKKFFTSDYSVIRAMFDQILARNCSLHEAVLNRDVKAVERLINTVNVNSLDAGGRTPIHLVAIMHDSAPEVIEKCKQISMLLLSHGANITIADAVFHWTPLRYADATQAWNIVGLILEHGGCTKDLIFTKMQLKNMTYIIPALCDATKGGYHKFLNFLVRSGIKVNIVLDCNKRQMIHLAAEYGQVVIVEYLLKAGVKLHIRDGKGWMPVHYAARTNHVDMVRYLLSGQYPVTWMKNGHNPENLIENKCKTAVNLVLQKSQSLAIQRASDVNVQDSYKWTPLHHAASTGQLEVVRYLCKEQAAQVDAVDQDGWTPLHYACSNDHLDVVKYLVETAGAYPDQRDRCQQTPLHSCVIRGRLRIVRYLAEEGGANINVQDQGGWTLLHCAAMSSRLDIVKYLTETLGANLLSRDKLGQTPLDMACGQDIRLYLTHYLAQGDVTTWKY